jgi:hypothetical protein
MRDICTAGAGEGAFAGKSTLSLTLSHWWEREQIQTLSHWWEREQIQTLSHQWEREQIQTLSHQWEREKIQMYSHLFPGQVSPTSGRAQV